MKNANYHREIRDGGSYHIEDWRIEINDEDVMTIHRDMDSSGFDYTEKREVTVPLRLMNPKRVSSRGVPAEKSPYFSIRLIATEDKRVVKYTWTQTHRVTNAISTSTNNIEDAYFEITCDENLVKRLQNASVTLITLAGGTSGAFED